MDCLQDTCRPGGLTLTEYALSLCRFVPGAQVADIGCGSGATLDFLASVCGFQAVGLELEPAFCDGIRILQGDGAALPFADRSLDGILMECSFSRMEQPDLVLAACRRVLKPEGRLILSDMIARGEEMELTGLLGRLEHRESIEERMERTGLMVEYGKDYSGALQELWGQMLLEGGEDALGVPRELLKRARCGYYLWICRQKG